MPKVIFGRWTGEDWDSISLEELINRLSDQLLNSGFLDPYSNFYRQTSDLDLESLYRALIDALIEQGLLTEEQLDQFLDADGNPNEKFREILDGLIRRMLQEGYLKEAPTQHSAHKGTGKNAPPVRFEITDKTVDFLGFKTLKDLLASLGRSSFGRHDTNYLSTGVEAFEASKPYEFGDYLNLDISETLLNSMTRQCKEAASRGQERVDVLACLSSNLQYADLMVRQTEYQSSCATVLLLDTSHSMILYGEDRFTPAKRVALALSHLIRTQYPGDSLHVILFHDSAEEIPLKKLAHVKVGPYYTNTREGLRLARSVLDRERKDMRQIIMITDGKPSAVTLPNGQIYKNAFGLDPMIIGETFKEVGYCRRNGILINTFMLARDHYLVEFVKKVSQICRGKAYFATTLNLGQYILMDYMKRKTRTIH
ncbi:MAG TPA: VWA domain-containing protein [Acidobacteriota bacterium]|jgi:Ca-activated chloride channel family protein